MNTVENSYRVADKYTKIPSEVALSGAFRLTENGKMWALINALVSNINELVIFLQQGIEYVFGEPVTQGRVSKFVQLFFVYRCGGVINCINLLKAIEYLMTANL